MSTLAQRATTTIVQTIVATQGATPTEIVRTIAIAAAPTGGKKAASQSVFDHDHAPPNAVDPSNPIKLFIIQAVIIILLSRALSIGLSRMRQPRVIADVITGVLLGPSAFGRIPGFTRHIFPSPSIPYLNLVANIGLVLFLFLVGVEVDFSVFRKNAKSALAVSAVGMAVPFGLGCAVSIGVYNEFIDTSAVSFGHFLLFLGVAFAITAFPVLARILTELKLLQDEVGVVTLAAGVGNDVVGWVLLALTVALVNAGTGVTAVYILLVAVGWALVLYFIVKPIFYRFCRWSGSLDGHGPTQGTMIVVIVLTLASAFLTDIIGVHAIFGGFLVGLIMPKTNGFASAITEKIEDLVTVLFLPLYFALSGLKTDLSLLKDGSIWGWTACIVIVAFLSKFLTCAVAARATGFKNRESLTIGALMSCKGLVELIVLNIGLNAGILNAQVFAACVVMALVTTFATTPLVLWFYPQWYRDQKEAALRTGELAGALPTLDKDGKPREAGDGSTKDRFTVVLDRLENLPPLMAFVKLLQPPTILPRPVSIASDGEAKKSDEGSVSSSSAALTRPVHVNAHRLLELSERTSDVLRASTETDEIAQKDPLTNIFKTFAGLNGISVNATLAIVPSSDYHKSIVKSAVDSSADMVIVPWAEGAHAVSPVGHAGESYNPLENIFARGSNDSHLTSPQYANLVRDIFASSSCDVGVFLDRGAGSLPSAVSGSRQHVFFAFRGGFDDRAALQLVVQLCRHTGVSATVVRVVKAADATDSDSEEGLEKTESLEPTPALLSQMTVHATAHAGGADTVYGHQTTHDVLASSTADDLCLARYFGETPDPAFAEALVRVKYSEVRSAAPLKAVLNQAQRAAKEWAASASDRSLPSPSPMMVVVGRGRRGAESHRDELAVILKQHAAANGGVSSLGIAASSDVRRSLGDVGSAVVVDGVGGSLLVIQAGVPKQD